MPDGEDLARQYLESFNSRNWDGMRAVLHPEFTYTGGDGNTMMGGPDVAVSVAQVFSGAMSDATITIKKVHTSGDTVVVEFIGSGTHDGDFAGVAPTNKKVTMPVVTILEIKGDKIAAEREYMDVAHLMQQIGALPAPATA